MPVKDLMLQNKRGWSLQTKLMALFTAFGIVPMIISFGLTMISEHVNTTMITEEIVELVVVIAAVAAAGYYFSRSLAHRLQGVCEAVESLAQGSVDVNTDDQQADEIGRIWDALSELKDAVRENARIKQMVEALPINVMTADLKDFKIDYANKATLDTVRQLESVMPVKADELVGTCIDIFHKDPSHQRRLLSDPKNLPHQAVIQFAGEYLDLLVSPLNDAQGKYIGPMVSWSIVTDKVKADEEATRLLSMVNKMPINVMTLDPEDFTINYINETSVNTLRTVEHLLPCKAEEVLGKCVDIFHKHPEHQRNLLSNPDNLPHKANIKLGDEVLSLEVSAVRDKAGKYIGPMVAWSVITDQVTIASRVREVVDSVASSSTEMKSTAESMSSTAEETNSQASAVAAAAEQATNNVQTVASAAEELSASINEIGEQVSQSTVIAQKAVDETQKTNETVQGLAEAAQKIGDVVNLINDIAAQTNLLALNATIEAARAGDAGKGFAVVASEVKSLANQTAQATEEIAGQINAMQSVTGDAVTAIGGITTTIEQINEIASGIAAAVEQQGSATQEIARNVQEASQGTQDVSENITGVTQAAQETGKASEDLLTASAELARQGNDLKDEIESFMQKIGAA